ncbi:MAG: cation:proton antiporter, partial [Nanoarchaeota archaeon]
MLIISLLIPLLFWGQITIVTFLFAMLFAIVMSGTDPGSVFILLHGHSTKVINFLKIESIINTPFMVILPLVIIDIINNLGESTVAEALFEKIIPFLKLIIVGVGAGVIIGVVIFRSMRKVYSQQYSPIALITAALLAFSVAENLEGNGVLAVATLGLFFGNMYVKEKESLQEFSSTLGYILVILVFVLVGIIIQIDFSLLFMLKALLVFAALVVMRFAAIMIGLRGDHFSFKEKFFMTISMPKGIAAAVVAFTLSVFPISALYQPYMQTILQLMTLIIIYSLLASSIIDRFSKKLIHVKLEEK